MTTSPPTHHEGPPMTGYVIHREIAAVICRQLGHDHPGAGTRSGSCDLAHRVATATLEVFARSGFRDAAVARFRNALYFLDQAWDAEPGSYEWHAEQARVVVSELLTMLGAGTPTMRGEHCSFVFLDGSRCVFGRHHTVGYHHSDNGQDQPVVAV